jgi:hypothetical protein
VNVISLLAVKIKSFYVVFNALPRLFVLSSFSFISINDKHKLAAEIQINLDPIGNPPEKIP